MSQGTIDFRPLFGKFRALLSPLMLTAFRGRRCPAGVLEGLIADVEKELTAFREQVKGIEAIGPDDAQVVIIDNRVSVEGIFGEMMKRLQKQV